MNYSNKPTLSNFILSQADILDSRKMETRKCISSQNGENKLITFIPEFKITKLTKVTDPRIVKSPSLPASPLTLRTEVKQKPVIPAYLTLGRKGFNQKISDEEFGVTPKSTSEGKEESELELEKIRSILSSLDLAKYRRKPREAERDVSKSLQRSLSVQPQSNLTKKSFLDNIPPPPKTASILSTSTPLSQSFYSETLQGNPKEFSLELVPASKIKRPVNNKLRELTEKLKPSSAPPSPNRRMKSVPPHTAPPTSTFSFFKDPLPTMEPAPFPSGELKTELTWESGLPYAISRSKSDDFSLCSTTALSNVPKCNSVFRHSAYATLPRVNQMSKPQRREVSILSSLDLSACLEPLKRYYNDANAPSKVQESQTKVDSYPQFPKLYTHEKPSETELDNNTSMSESVETFSPQVNNKNANKHLAAFPHKEKFDLNFVNYRSLTLPQTFFNEKEVSVEKHSSDDLTINPSSHNQSDESEKTDLIEMRQEEKPEVRNSEIKDRLNDLSTKKKHYSDPIETEKESDPVPVAAARSEPELQTSVTKMSRPLEEEIRTIAKLLDGKESLFLKLINSSKAQDDSCYHDGSFSPPPECESPPPQTAPVILRSSHAPRFTSADGATRLRAMTVPVTETNRQSQVSSPPQQKRYFKKRLRGPYGEMLEQEMSKSKQRPSYAKDLDFLKELDEVKTSTNSSSDKQTRSGRPLLRSSSHSLDETHTIKVDSGTPKRKTSANIPIMTSENDHATLCVPTSSVASTVSEPILHIRSHSDTVKTLDNWTVDTTINRILKETSLQDTRTHIVSELYETEKSYVESLQIIVKKYMRPLKGSEHAGVVDKQQVDEIFCHVPEIFNHHEAFLEVLKQRLTYWDTKQKIGDVFIDVFTRQSVVDTYIAYINNWKSARDSIKAISQAKPAFAKFLEHTSREHKGKLTLDALLIMPVQRIPRYELLIKELLKHTPLDHPDHKLLLQAQKEVHDLAMTINRVEREALQKEQMIQKVKEIEQLIEGVIDLTQGERYFIRHDFVTIPGGLGIKKDRCIFLFSDLMLITSIKRKSAVMRKTSLAFSPYGSLESNKYKLLMKMSLYNVEVIRTDDDEPCVRKFLKEVGNLEGDVIVLGKINEMLNTLSCPHHNLDEAVKEMLNSVSKELIDKQSSNSQLMNVELAVTMNDQLQNITAIFPNPEQRMMWEAAFLDAKEKLDMCSQLNMPPEFMCSLPIRKTRSGLQITCTASVVDSCQSGLPDLWICSSDGYIGQVCVLTFQNEPVIASCSSICNGRILCIAAVPGICTGSLVMRRRSTLLPHLPGFKFERLGSMDKNLDKGKNFHLDSDSEDDFIDSTEEEMNVSHEDEFALQQATMWLGTEDGCILVYNCTDIKLQETRLKLQHSTCIYDITYVEGRIFVSLANGEVLIYSRDPGGIWITSNPQRLQIASTVAPITKMVLINGKLWCASLNSILIINCYSFEIEHTFQVAPDLAKHVTAIVMSSQGVWVSIQNSPVLHMFHTHSYEELLDVNVSNPVTKMLSACDNIIRQHKSACLRVSALSVQKDLLWIGTSAGVILTLPLILINSSTQLEILSSMFGMAHGHSGHVRFLTSICAPTSSTNDEASYDLSVRPKESTSKWQCPSTSYSALVISGGDGYEDFSNLAVSEAAGRDDSTNHMLMWRV